MMTHDNKGHESGVDSETQRRDEQKAETEGEREAVGDFPFPADNLARESCFWSESQVSCMLAYVHVTCTLENAQFCMQV